MVIFLSYVPGRCLQAGAHMAVSRAASWTCSYQGYLWDQSPAAGCASLQFLSSLEDDREALLTISSPSYHTSKSLSGCHQSCGAVTKLPYPGELWGRSRVSSACEVSLHPSLGGSAQSDPRAGWVGYWGLAPGIAILRCNQINNEC